MKSLTLQQREGIKNFLGLCAFIAITCFLLSGLDLIRCHH